MARLGDRVYRNQFRGRRWFWVGAGRIDDRQRRSRTGRASRHSLHGRGRHSSLQPLSSGVPVLPSADDRSLRDRELPIHRSAAPPTRPDIDAGLYRRNGRPGTEDEPVVCAIGRLKNPGRGISGGLAAPEGHRRAGEQGQIDVSCGSEPRSSPARAFTRPLRRRTPRRRDGFRRAADVGANRGVDQRHERSFQRASCRLASRRGRRHGGAAAVCNTVGSGSRLPRLRPRGRDKGRLARLESLHRGGRLRPGAR